jgi:hypothetical protein
LTQDEVSFSGTEDQRRDRASAPILNALNKAKEDFRDWQDICQLIDDVYSRVGSSYDGLYKLYGGQGAWADSDLDLFWASMEVLKPATYARPPKPAVKPRFSDSDRVKLKTAELLERVSAAVLAFTDIGDVMCEIRDDLLFTNRGVLWLRYESDDKQKVCWEQLDRRDFLHEPCRKWSEVGWVAGGFWMTFDEMKKRFGGKDGLSEDVLHSAKFTRKRDDQSDGYDNALTQKCQVWEVWHRADDKVYWVTEGIDVLLDSGPPHLKLSSFFPCPRPAYGTRQRRSLIPVPDWDRYAIHFRKISDLTGRIYRLLDDVRMKGLIPAGGDVGDAVEALIRSDDDRLLIPVAAAAMMEGNAQGFVVWLPLAELATAIQGLIEARAQLIQDFYQLSGISDIMRGATEAEETLGAQQLKSQYGSVRVKDKIDELQRIAADGVGITAEIAAEHFSQKTLLDLAQMEIPTRKEIEKRVKEIEKGAEEELKALKDKASQMAQQAQQSGQQIDPAQAQQQFEQAQQAIIQKYAPMLEDAQQQVAIEDVMKLLRDDRARSFAFEIESDSTILTDELQEKASRNEFMSEFTTASQALMGMASMGEQGAKLAGEMLKFVLAPYRAGRQLDGAIDAFIEAAPQMAAAAKGQEGDSEALAEANNKLAEAEMEKARAAMAGVQAKAALDQAENQRKIVEMQQKAMEAERKHAAEIAKIQITAADAQAKADKAIADMDKVRAETLKILNDIRLANQQQVLDEFESVADIDLRQGDQAMAAQGQASDERFREQDAERADRGEERADRGEDRADRQQQFSEQQETRP